MRRAQRMRANCPACSRAETPGRVDQQTGRFVFDKHRTIGDYFWCSNGAPRRFNLDIAAALGASTAMGSMGIACTFTGQHTWSTLFYGLAALFAATGLVRVLRDRP